MKHELRPLAYMRYGDDWLCFVETKEESERIQQKAEIFLQTELHLTINPKINIIQPTHKGIHYLGVDIWPHGHRLQPKVRERIDKRITLDNAASYKGLISKHEHIKRQKYIDWKLLGD